MFQLIICYLYNNLIYLNKDYTYEYYEEDSVICKSGDIICNYRTKTNIFPLSSILTFFCYKNCIYLPKYYWMCNFK